MGFLVRLFLALVTAAVLGVSYAWFSLDSVPEADFAANGAWRVAPEMRDSKLSVFERAALAKTNLLVPDPRDVLDLTAYTDETGASLDGRCTYRIEGAALPAKSWSVSAYGPGHFLIANPQNRYAITAQEASNADGSYLVRASGSRQAGPWLPLDGVQKFSLTLRLYEPADGVSRSPTSFKAPRIIKERCQ